MKKKLVRPTPKLAAATSTKPIHVPSTPEQVAASLFNGRPKPRDKWRYIKENRAR